MKLEGYYSSGQFAKKAQVSVRTIRFYDKQGILKPSLVQNGSRFYTDDDFTRLQQVLLLKYLGFALEDIKEMTIGDPDYHIMLNSLNIQKKLIQDRIEQMQLVEQAINQSIEQITLTKKLDSSQMLNLIHLTSMENSLKTQYQNSNNINARIRLHKDYSINPQGWFPWLFEQLPLSSQCTILEIGCGNGALWLENLEKIPENISITLTDISKGMVREVKRTFGRKDKRFTFQNVDVHKIPYDNNAFDIVIANHVLFYCNDVNKALSEIKRVLKPSGSFFCSTYGSNHMKEITQLVQKFNEHILLSNGNLYDKFGLQSGLPILQSHFSDVSLKHYEDEIIIDDSDPLIDYILSCHGNQNQFLSNNYHDFKKFVNLELQKPFHITKEAGVFICLNR